MLLSLINDGLLDYVAMDVKNSPEKYALTAGVGAEFRMQNAECRIESAELRMHNAECRIENAELRMQSAECRIENAECRIVGANVDNRDAVSEEPLLTVEGDDEIIRRGEHCLSEEPLLAGEVAPQATERLLSNEKRGVYAPIMEKIKQSCDILRRGLVDFEFRTTLMRELHSEEDIRSIGRWLSGDEKYFLQTYRDEGDLLVGGFTAYSPDETRQLLAILREYIPNAEIR